MSSTPSAIHPKTQPAPEAAAQKLPPVQLYDLQADERERSNLQDRYPREVHRLERLLEHYIAAGRSTPGPSQQNEVKVDLWKKSQSGK